MKGHLCLGATLLLVGPLAGVKAGPKEDVAAAAKKLGGQANYSWRTTVVVPEGSRFRPGPTEGKTAQDGLTDVVMTFGDNRARVVIKGDKVAVTDQDGTWKSVAELENAEGAPRFLARFARSIRTPAVQAAQLVADAKDLQKEGDALAGTLTEEGAKALVRFRRGGDGPAVSNARGAVKFWLQDGALAKYEYKVQGTINVGGNDIEVDRTTTVEIKDVGTTKLEVPEAASKLLQ